MSSLEIEVEVNEAYINRVTPKQRVVAVLDAYPDWDPGPRDHHGADGRSAEGDRARAGRLRRARPAHPARHGRQGPPRGRAGDRGEPGAAADPRAEDRDPHDRQRQRRVRRAAATSSSSVPSRSAAPTATVEVISGLQSGERVVAPVPDTLKDGTAVTVSDRSLVVPADFGTLVRIADVHKFYSRGNERVDVLQGVNIASRRATSSRSWGPPGRARPRCST